MPSEDGVYFYSSAVQLLTFLCISYLAENEKTYSGGESYAKNLNPVEIFHPRAQHWFEIFDAGQELLTIMLVCMGQLQLRAFTAAG